MKSKALYTINIGNYEPRICEMTYPRFDNYAKKIGADFHVITHRKFPTNDIEYEKLQGYDLAEAYEWVMYIDSDALIHPELFDITFHLSKDTILHHGVDKADLRWTLDPYFRRDGRLISSCNWMAVASHWCRDLWKSPEDLTEQEAVAAIHPTPRELAHGVSARHLVTDYLLSRNIARYGLKVTTFFDLLKKLGREGSNYFFHEYTVPIELKIARIRAVADNWDKFDRRFDSGEKVAFLELPRSKE